MADCNQSSHPASLFGSITCGQTGSPKNRVEKQEPPSVEQPFFIIYSNLAEAPPRRDGIYTNESAPNIQAVKAGERTGNTRHRRQRR